MTNIHKIPSLSNLHIAKNGFVTMISQGIKIILTLGMQVAITRFLVPEDFGIVAMVAPVLGFVQVIADLGIRQIIIQKETLSHDEINILFWRNAKASVFLALISAFSAPLLVILYNETRVFWVAIALSLLLMISSLSTPSISLINREMNYVHLAFIENVALVIGAVIGIGGALLGFGYWSLVFSQFGTSVGTLILGWVLSEWRPSAPPNKIISRDLTLASGNITVAKVVGYLNTSLDNVLVGAFLGQIELGIYDRAWKFAAQPTSMLLAPIEKVIIPVLSKINKEHEKYNNVFIFILKIEIITTLPLMLFLVQYAHPLVSAVFGNQWREMVGVFQWICFGSIITPINASMFWLFISQGRTGEQMKWATRAALVNVTAYAFGLHWGLTLVASASALSNWLIQMPLLVRAATKIGPVRWTGLPKMVIPFLAGSASEVGGFYLLNSWLDVSGFLKLAFVSISGYLFFLIGVLLFSDGRKTIKKIIKFLNFDKRLSLIGIRK